MKLFQGVLTSLGDPRTPLLEPVTRNPLFRSVREGSTQDIILSVLSSSNEFRVDLRGWTGFEGMLKWVVKVGGKIGCIQGLKALAKYLAT